MKLEVNGTEGAWPDGLTVHDLVLEVAGTERGVAVSVDREVVPRSEWLETTLAEGASVEVLVAAAGG
jgi:sulfur carrier protein